MNQNQGSLKKKKKNLGSAISHAGKGWGKPQKTLARGEELGGPRGGENNYNLERSMDKNNGGV